MPTHETLTSLFSDIANSIRSKNGSTATIVADEFNGAISNLNTGIGLSSAASAGDIASGKKAVVNNAIVTGTMGTTSLTVNDSTLAVSPTVTPTATASATANGISLGTMTTTVPATGGYIAATGGNSETTGSAVSGESAQASTGSGKISASTKTITSTATAKANASTKTVYYPITASTLTNAIISGAAFEEASGDYAWKSTVEIPAGYHAGQTLTKNFSSIFPAPGTEGTAGELLLGYQLFNHDGKLLTGTMPNNGAVSGSITSQGGQYTIPAGYHNGSGVITASLTAGSCVIAGGGLSQGTASGGGLSGGDLSGGGLSGGGLTAGAGEVSITQQPIVTPSIGGTGVGTTATTSYGVTTTKPSGTDGTNFFTFDPDATYTQQGKAKGRGSVSRATITRAAVTRATVNRAAFSQAVSRAAVTDAHTAGYIPAKSATTVIAAATSTVTLAAGSLAQGTMAAATIASGSTVSNYSAESSTSGTVNAGTNYYIPVSAATAAGGSATATATVTSTGLATVTSSSYYVTASASSSANGGSASVSKGITSGASASGTATGTKSASKTVYIKAGAITNNTSGGTSSGTINRGSQIKIGQGYYPSDLYYTAQANSGNIQLTTNASTSVNGYSTATVKSGSASVTSKSATLTPTISISGTTATISVSGTVAVAGSATAGWISSVTGGTVTISGSTKATAASVSYNSSTEELTVTGGLIILS